MAGTKCVLDILKQNEFIQIKLVNDRNFSLKVWELELKNITDSDIRKKVIEKILTKMESDDEYIIGYKWPTSFRFTTKEEMDQLINTFLQTGKERQSIYIDYKGFPRWIRSHYNVRVVHGAHSDYHYKLINLEVENERKEKEQNNDKKVLELLDDIL